MPDYSFGTIPFLVELGVVRFLLVWETWGSGMWNFPKGHAEEGEFPLATALRELKEETGIVPTEVVSNQPLIREYSFEHEGRTIHRRLEYFLVRVDEQEVRLQKSEVKDSRWMTLEELQLVSPFPELLEMARQAHNMIRKTEGNA